MWHKLQNWALGVGVLLLCVILATVLTSGAIAVLMLRDLSAPGGPTPPAAGPSRPGVPQDPEGAPQRAIGQGVLALRTEPRGSGAAERTPPPRRSTPTRALETVDPRELLRQADMPK